MYWTSRGQVPDAFTFLKFCVDGGGKLPPTTVDVESIYSCFVVRGWRVVVNVGVQKIFVIFFMLSTV